MTDDAPFVPFFKDHVGREWYAIQCECGAVHATCAEFPSVACRCGYRLALVISRKDEVAGDVPQSVLSAWGGK